MIGTCKRLIRKFPNLSLGLAGIGVMHLPIPLCVNLSHLDEGGYVTDAYYPYYTFVLRILFAICCLASLVGIGMISTAILLSVRRLQHGKA